MTTTIASSEIESNLQSLLQRVQAGDRFVITEEGRAVAELVPVKYEAAAPQKPAEEIIAALKAARDARPPVSRAEIRAMIEEGRR